MSDISTDAMMREAAMMDASDNHVWARKTRRLCIERDTLQARLAEVEADKRWIMEERDRTFALMLSRAEAAEARVKELEEALRDIVDTGGQFGSVAHMAKVDAIARAALAAMEGAGMSDFRPGDTVKHIVGLPGPDIDVATVVAKREDGNYDIRFQVWGQGTWHDGVGFPDKKVIGGIFK